MKGIFCYYSGSGNTRLACEYIAGKTTNIKFDFYNTLKNESPDLKKYDLVGLATFTDFWGVPNFFKTFIESLYPEDKKPAFIFNTFGNITGKTLAKLNGSAVLRGFNIIAGHSLHTPESFPPMVAAGNGNEKAPNKKEKDDFNTFISRLNKLIGEIKDRKEIKKIPIKKSFLTYILPAFPRTRAKKVMGSKYVDAVLCDECGICKKKCPYDAVELHPKPIFDEEKCNGCWACFNHCPELAIYTKKFRGIGHYPRPHGDLIKKLKN